MAQHQQHHGDLVAPPAPEDSGTPPAPAPAPAPLDDSMLEIMRVGGYVGLMPYRAYPDLSPGDQRAIAIGLRYLAERACQSALANADPAPADPAGFIRNFLASWRPPATGRELHTVAWRRAQIAREYIAEKFAATLTAAKKAEAAAAIEEYLPQILAHPRHAAEIEARLVTFYTARVEEEAAASTEGKAPKAKAKLALNLDAA